jgi:hypothetical protein
VSGMLAIISDHRPEVEAAHMYPQHYLTIKIRFMLA